ncbi:unnamed protein product [Cuscuta campestris]|uniref:Uncharacterized protein n=1 Tax=Cuscuta campestris TaxID=132261 RepID=A0A484NLC8_9ASTE|nr:unnamed protein product [Cuscuta campestris]
MQELVEWSQCLLRLMDGKDGSQKPIFDVTSWPHPGRERPLFLGGIATKKVMIIFFSSFFFQECHLYLASAENRMEIEENKKAIERIWRRRLKIKFLNHCQKGNASSSSNPTDAEVFSLAKEIWGLGGVAVEQNGGKGEEEGIWTGNPALPSPFQLQLHHS